MDNLSQQPEQFTPPPEDKIEQPKETLKREVYLRIAEDHPVGWTHERIFRDIWQNFFDAAGGTLDGIHPEFDFLPGGQVAITIRGKGSFDYRTLLQLGASTKLRDKTTVGEKGEGTRMAALQLLKDFGSPAVVFGSQNWRSEFLLKPIADEDRPPHLGKGFRGLYLDIYDLSEEIEGTFVIFIVPSIEIAQQLEAARELFRHQENADFKDPTYENKRGGFKYLEEDQRGNFYFTGQRVSVEKRDEWQTLERMNLWTKLSPHYKDEELKIGRDRDLVTLYEVETVAIPFIVEGMTTEEAKELLFALRPEWSKKSRWDRSPGNTLVAELIEQKLKELKLDFEPRYLADDLNPSSSGYQRAIDELQKNGLVICLPQFKLVGMRTITEHKEQVVDFMAVEPSPEEKKRLEILERHVAGFIDSLEPNDVGTILDALGLTADIVARSDVSSLGTILSKLKAKSIYLFSNDHPGALAEAGTDDYIWFSQEALRTSFWRARATYLHELAHEAGNDQSEAFSYALTVLLAELPKYDLANANEVKQAVEAWEEIELSELRPSFERFLKEFASSRDLMSGWFYSYNRDQVADWAMKLEHFITQTGEASSVIEGLSKFVELANKNRRSVKKILNELSVIEGEVKELGKMSKDSLELCRADFVKYRELERKLLLGEIKRSKKKTRVIKDSLEKLKQNPDLETFFYAEGSLSQLRREQYQLSRDLDNLISQHGIVDLAGELVDMRDLVLPHHFASAVREYLLSQVANDNFTQAQEVGRSVVSWLLEQITDLEQLVRLNELKKFLAFEVHELRVQIDEYRASGRPIGKLLGWWRVLRSTLAEIVKEVYASQEKVNRIYDKHDFFESKSDNFDEKELLGGLDDADDDPEEEYYHPDMDTEYDEEDQDNQL